jgi:hypothetical protein
MARLWLMEPLVALSVSCSLKLTVYGVVPEVGVPLILIAPAPFAELLRPSFGNPSLLKAEMAGAFFVHNLQARPLKPRDWTSLAHSANFNRRAASFARPIQTVGMIV